MICDISTNVILKSYVPHLVKANPFSSDIVQEMLPVKQGLHLGMIFTGINQMLCYRRTSRAGSCRALRAWSIFTSLTWPDLLIKSFAGSSSFILSQLMFHRSLRKECCCQSITEERSGWFLLAEELPMKFHREVICFAAPAGCNLTLSSLSQKLWFIGGGLHCGRRNLAELHYL
ncbi:Uncharacterized protein Fot_37048 [Forsythia ovata]|uniref:Uncharacterized protein n=1 Tax=Forsythia ovata TaxID=205694 RepID=A0ABD1SR58_9LAMI